MDTTAAAELGALDAVNYWALAPQQHDHFVDDDDGRQPWTPPPDYRQATNSNRSNGGEPPYKKTKIASATAFTPPHQGYDAFEPSNAGGGGGSANSETTGQGASSGTPPPPEASAASSGGTTKNSGNGRPSFGKMFFKTKLCCKFRAGTCPYLNNCNFAHGMEELRKPPPNWQEIVAQQEELTLRAERWGGGDNNNNHHHRQHPQTMMTVVPSLSPPSAAVVVAGNVNGGDGIGGGSASPSSQRFHKTRFCKKYYTDEGCPYGDSCNFLHDDQGRSRESVAISLGPSGSNGGGNEFVVANGGAINNGNGANGVFQRPMYWKTRICNKWETTGHCPFGDKCHFAHGVAELQKYGGGLLDSESGATSGGLRNDFKQIGSALKPHTEPGIGPPYLVFGTDNYTIGNSNQRSISNIQGQRQGQRAFPKWKGPDKISQIYGDWIDDNEWEYTSHLALSQPEEASQIHEEEPQDARMKRIEKWQNVSQGQTNIPFCKGSSEQNNNRNHFSKGGGKGRDITSLGGNFDQVYEDDTLVGEL